MNRYTATWESLTWEGPAKSAEDAARRFAASFAGEHEFDGAVEVTDHATSETTTHHVVATLSVYVDRQTGDYPPAADLVRDALRDATATAERLRCERDAALSALHASIAARRGLTWRQRLRALLTGEVM